MVIFGVITTLCCVLYKIFYIPLCVNCLGICLIVVCTIWHGVIHSNCQYSCQLSLNITSKLNLTSWTVKLNGDKLNKVVVKVYIFRTITSIIIICQKKIWLCWWSDYYWKNNPCSAHSGHYQQQCWSLAEVKTSLKYTGSFKEVLQKRGQTQ